VNCLHRGSAGGWHFDPDSVIMVERKMSLRSVTLESTSMGVDSSSRCLLNVDGDTVHDHRSLGQTPCLPL